MSKEEFEGRFNYLRVEIYQNPKCDGHYLNAARHGAWWAWQEQQKVIDELKSKSKEALECFNDGNFNYCRDILEDILK